MDKPNKIAWWNEGDNIRFYYCGYKAKSGSDSMKKTMRRTWSIVSKSCVHCFFIDKDIKDFEYIPNIHLSILRSYN